MSRSPSSPILLVAAILALPWAAPQRAMAQSAWYEGFEQMAPSWEFLDADGPYVLRGHQRTPQIRNTGERSEWISVAGEGGTYVYMAHEVGRPRVIAELTPTIQVQADRPGIQLLAELTLPRSSHPQTGQPLTTLVRGTSYTNVGKWQQLRIDDLPLLLTRQTRILRAEFGPSVDPREAYISRIVLNVYAGPGVTNVWIDDLDVSGYVEASPNQPVAPAAIPPSPPPAPTSPWQGAGSPPVDDNTQRRVHLDRSVLLVDDSPFFVRAVRWRGEPLTALRSLGFNTVWLDRFPSAELLAEAERTGMWLISPPPLPQLPPAGNAPSAPPIFGPEYRSVLAWDLGEGLEDRQEEVDSVRLWAERIRTADTRFRRPLIARPESNLRAYSRIADILVIGRPALGSSLELSEYAQWLRLRPQLARPGTPIWVVVPTGPEPALLAQWQTMSPGELAAAGFSSEQLRLITYLSCASGARGLLFESYTPIDSTEPWAEVRRVSLELFNLELTLAEPWLAGGNVTAMAYSKANPEILAPVFRTDRAQLAIPIWAGPGAGQVPAPGAQRSISVVVPGVPEADNVHELTPGRPRRARYKRIAGGTEVVIDSFALTTFVLLTQDQLAFTSCNRRTQTIGPRAAELQRRLAELKTEQFERLIVPVTLGVPGTRQLKALEAEIPTLRRTAQESLARCGQALASRDYAGACVHAAEAMRPMQLLEREHWQAASQSVTGSASSPMLATFATLPGHWALLRAVSQSPPGTNLLPAGDFENLQAWLGSGWEHIQHPVTGVTPRADLVPEAARSGTLGLRLAVTATDSEQVPQLVESAPVWIASAPVNLDARTLVAIRGWVRIPEPIQGSADGLLVIDSLTGPALAERIQANDEWQEFVLYRVYPQSGPLRLTFAMTGMGTAYIDDVSIQTLAPAPTPVAAQAGYPAVRR
ncbi:MAG: hypothetical protein GXX96_17495 [Planctomycetaceae bacterium]|nr:hypothetical protein [Planctomycetaceae bacterium]